MNFEEWLEKNIIQNLKLPFKGGIADVELDVVSVHALGEWAWEIWEKGIENSKSFGENSVFTPKYTELRNIIEIAEACLGKKEIEKRLKSLEWARNKIEGNLNGK